MNRQKEIKTLIQTHRRRLHELKMRKARQGDSVEVSVITEIEDIEADLEKLQLELSSFGGVDTSASFETLSLRDQQYQIALNWADDGRKVKLSRFDLSNTDLRLVDLKGANLSLTDFSQADLYGADLQNADLRLTTFKSANLGGADLRGADLREANLREANLRGADLRGANLKEAKLWRSDLKGANLDPVQAARYSLTKQTKAGEKRTKNE